MTLNDLMLLADEYADTQSNASRRALVVALRTSLPSQEPERKALNDAQLNALHTKLGGIPSKPTVNPGKVKETT